VERAIWAPKHRTWKLNSQPAIKILNSMEEIAFDRKNNSMKQVLLSFPGNPQAS
jgi:hypothetical protein